MSRFIRGEDRTQQMAAGVRKPRGFRGLVRREPLRKLANVERNVPLQRQE